MSIYDVTQEEVDGLMSMFHNVVDEQATAPKTAPPEPDYIVSETFVNKREAYRNREIPYASPVIKSKDILLDPARNQKGLSNKTVIYSLKKYRKIFG